MFCSQCLTAVGPRERVCNACGADLTAPGSVRLTDPRRISAKPATTFEPAAINEKNVATPQVKSHVATDVAITQPRPATGSAQPRSTSGEGSRPPTGSPSPVVTDIDEARAASFHVELSQRDEPVTTTQPRPRVTPSGNEPAESGAVQRPGFQAPTPPATEPAITVTRRRDPSRLSLWDDYGMAEEPELAPVEPGISSRDQIDQLLGASAVPAAKWLSAAAILGATALVLLLLVGRLLTLDSLVVTRAKPQPVPATSASAEPEESVAPAPEEQPTTEPVPLPASITPSMQPGAKQCDPDIWAGSQTSCVLANEVGSQIDPKMAGSVIVEAFSTSSNRTYRLECVADEGITCTGLDGVEGLNVWIVATREG